MQRTGKSGDTLSNAFRFCTRERKPDESGIRTVHAARHEYDAVPGRCFQQLRVIDWFGQLAPQMMTAWGMTLSPKSICCLASAKLCTTEFGATIQPIRSPEAAILAAVPDPSGKHCPAGIIELGTGPKERKDFYIKSQKLVTEEDKAFVYLEPMIRCQVKIRNWYKSELLRDPVFTRFIMN